MYLENVQNPKIHFNNEKSPKIHLWYNENMQTHIYIYKLFKSLVCFNLQKGYIFQKLRNTFICNIIFYNNTYFCFLRYF